MMAFHLIFNIGSWIISTAAIGINSQAYEEDMPGKQDPLM